MERQNILFRHGSIETFLLKIDRSECFLLLSHVQTLISNFRSFSERVLSHGCLEKTKIVLSDSTINLQRSKLFGNFPSLRLFYYVNILRGFDRCNKAASPTHCIRMYIFIQFWSHKTKSTLAKCNSLVARREIWNMKKQNDLLQICCCNNEK